MATKTRTKATEIETFEAKWNEQDGTWDVVSSTGEILETHYDEDNAREQAAEATYEARCERASQIRDAIEDLVRGLEDCEDPERLAKILAAIQAA